MPSFEQYPLFQSVGADAARFIMPKLKSSSTAKKRFKSTGTGKIRRRKAYLRHILTSKTRKQKRRLGKSEIIDSANEKAIRRLLPYL
jgi:large subunit ribosomal protein L35